MDFGYIAGILLVVLVVGGGWFLQSRLFRWAYNRADHKRAVAQGRREAAAEVFGWHGDARALARNPGGWMIAASAPFAMPWQQPNDRLRYDEPAQVAASVRESWSITNSRDLVSQVLDLATGGHRQAFDAERRLWADMSDDQFRGVRKSLLASKTDLDSVERAERMHRVRRNERDCRDIDFLAWDHARAIMLTRAGLTLGMIDEPFALDVTSMLAEPLRARYDSWEQFSDHFLRARWYWRSSDGLQDAAYDAFDTARRKRLLTEGPWAFQPWNTPLPRSEMLLFRTARDLGLVSERADSELQRALA